MTNLLHKIFVHLGINFSTNQPDVIIDFIFEDGLLYISVKNIGHKAAYKVSITFDNQIIGVEGTKDISTMSLFRNIEFLAPGREIKTFLDTSTSYFRSENPAQITSKIIFFDNYGIKRKRYIKHNLDIYKDIGYSPSNL